MGVWLQCCSVQQSVCVGACARLVRGVRGGGGGGRGEEEGQRLVCAACGVGRHVEESGCCEVWVHRLQQRNAEWKCSSAGQAQMHASESVGERGAADTLMRAAR